LDNRADDRKGGSLFAFGNLEPEPSGYHIRTGQKLVPILLQNTLQVREFLFHGALLFKKPSFLEGFGFFAGTPGWISA
jgi:hypothetical protein